MPHTNPIWKKTQKDDVVFPRPKQSISLQIQFYPSTNKFDKKNPANISEKRPEMKKKIGVFYWKTLIWAVTMLTSTERIK